MSAPRGPRSWRAVLLCGLGFPGLGQLSQRRWGPAVAFGAATMTLLGVLLERVWTETIARLPEDPTELTARLLDDPLWSFRLAREIEHDNAAFFAWSVAGLLLVWIASVADAWRSSARGPEVRPRGPADGVAGGPSSHLKK